MKITLGRRTATPDAAWMRVRENIEDYVSRREVEHFADLAVSEIRARTRGKRCAVAWSGGKDSLVVHALVERAGVSRGVFVHTDLEYPAFMRWVEGNKPAGIEPLNTGHDLEWLARNPRFLFPSDAKTHGAWYQRVQQAHTRKYAERNRLDIMLFGRRRADGNGIRPGTGGVYNCIAEWPHELVLGFLHYYGLDLPPLYDWPGGFPQGTHTWNGRDSKGKTRGQVWGEIYQIDRGIVLDAARLIPSAREFLEARR